MRATVACEACRKRKIRCDGEQPCGSCRTSVLTCRYIRPKKTRPLTEQVDHIESLVERIFQDNNLIPSSDDDSDSGANDNDPEFGIRRIKVNPMDDPIYNFNLASEIFSPKYHKLLQQRIPPEEYRHYVEQTNKLGLSMMDGGGTGIGDLYSLDPAPPVEPGEYINFVREICSVENHPNLEFTLKLLIQPGEFKTLSPKGDTGTLFYGTLVCVLSNHNQNAKGEERYKKLKFLQWALQSGIRHAVRQLVTRATEDRLRAILMLFFSTHTCWMDIDTQVCLSRTAVEICRDLGLNRRSFYLSCETEKQSYWAALFWISYCVNRNVSLRYGYATAMESSEISHGIPALLDNKLVGGSKHYISLFDIYDRLWNATCSSAAEGHSIRQMVRHSLIALKDLDKWWKTVHPNWAPDANPTLLVKEFQEMYQNDYAVMTLLFFTLSVYYYIRMYVFRMCALTPASVQDHLESMFPSEVSALKESNGHPTTDMQARIAAIMSPSYSFRKIGVQFLKLCDTYQKSGHFSWAVYFDILMVTAALTVNVVICHQTDFGQDSALFRRVGKSIRETDSHPNFSLIELMIEKINNYADIIHACCENTEASPSLSSSAQPPSNEPSPASKNSVQLMNYGIAQSIESEIFSMESGIFTEPQFSNQLFNGTNEGYFTL